MCCVSTARWISQVNSVILWFNVGIFAISKIQTIMLKCFETKNVMNVLINNNVLRAEDFQIQSYTQRLRLRARYTVVRNRIVCRGSVMVTMLELQSGRPR